MSKNRQSVFEPKPDANPHLRVASVGFSPGYQWRSGGSAWGQLLYTTRGTMSAEAASGVWVVPSSQLLWLPPHLANAVWLSGKGALHRIYLRGAPCKRMPNSVRVIERTPLLSELVRRAVESGTLNHRRVREARLIDVLIDELTAARVSEIDLPMPRDARALRAAELVRANPGDARDAELVARSAGASVRTLERLFKHETRFSFGQWRQRARLLQSLVHIADGESVTRTALAVGYASASAYVAAFKAVMGTTPRAYVALAPVSRPRAVAR